jgi:hypothetical protein
MAKREKAKRLPVRIQKIVGACKAGQVLCLYIRHSEVGDERTFWLEPSGRTAGAKSAEEAIAAGLLVPNGDGLFGESQTFRAA